MSSHVTHCMHWPHIIRDRCIVINVLLPYLRLRGKVLILIFCPINSAKGPFMIIFIMTSSRPLKGSGCIIHPMNECHVEPKSLGQSNLVRKCGAAECWCHRPMGTDWLAPIPWIFYSHATLHQATISTWKWPSNTKKYLEISISLCLDVNKILFFFLNREIF